MSFSFIREGDTTSHEGKVLACTSTNILGTPSMAPMPLPPIPVIPEVKP